VLPRFCSPLLNSAVLSSLFNKGTAAFSFFLIGTIFFFPRDSSPCALSLLVGRTSLPPGGPTPPPLLGNRFLSVHELTLWVCEVFARASRGSSLFSPLADRGRCAGRGFPRSSLTLRKESLFFFPFFADRKDHVGPPNDHDSIPFISFAHGGDPLPRLPPLPPETGL